MKLDKTLEVVGSIPAGCWAFPPSLSIPKWGVLNQVPQGRRNTTEFPPQKLMLSLRRNKHNMHIVGKKYLVGLGFKKLLLKKDEAR